MRNFLEPGVPDVRTPIFERVQNSIPLVGKPLRVLSTGVRTEEHASWNKALSNCFEHARYRLQGNVKQGGVREHAVKSLSREP